MLLLVSFERGRRQIEPDGGGFGLAHRQKTLPVLTRNNGNVTRSAGGQDLIGRDVLLGRLSARVERVLEGERVTALVAGEAGIGKTSLVRAAASVAGARGALVAWGACVDIDGAPGYWPWRQALESLVRDLGAQRAREAAGDDAGLLAAISPSFGAPSHGEASPRGRLLLMDAVNRFLEALAATRPVVVVLDDLQWADDSSLALLDFVARAPASRPIGVIGAYRQDELVPPARARLGGLASRGEHIEVGGLDIDSVHQLLERVTGAPVERTAAAAVQRRTGGHPFFVRELALLAQLDDAPGASVPTAVRDAIERRVARLPTRTIDVLEVLSLMGTALLSDVAAAALGIATVDVEAEAAAAVGAGVLTHSDAGIGLYPRPVARDDRRAHRPPPADRAAPGHRLCAGGARHAERRRAPRRGCPPLHRRDAA